LSSIPTIAGPVNKIPRTREIAVIGLFGALSIILTIVSNLLLKLAFVPPVNYLLFDFGEIPVMICFMIIGPRAGLSVAVIEWFALNLLPTTTPLIGPLFKFMSVGLTLAGLWMAWKILAKSKITTRFGVGAVAAALLRASVMTLPNAAFLILSYHIPPTSSLLFLFLELTAFFNVLQIPFDLVPTYILLKLPQVRQMLLKNGMTWFESSAFGRTA
jgi:riboflavin transporter FmnP